MNIDMDSPEHPFSRGCRNALRLLHSIESKIDALEQARRLYEPQLASRFNAIGVLKPGEIHLSRILAEILDPSGSHGQGPMFLDAFIERFGGTLKIDASWNARQQAVIGVEVLTHTGRRIDLAITCPGAQPHGKWAIGIENKPWASDQENQVRDYLDYLALRYPGRHRLIYLSGNGEPPPESSSGSQLPDTVAVISYLALMDWLQDCAACCRAARVRYFLEELHHYIGQNFAGMDDMTEYDMIVNEACKSPDSIEAALHIAAAIDGIKTRLLRKLWQDCRERAAARGWEIQIPGFEHPGQSKHKPMELFFSKGDQYKIAFEFGANGCNDGVIGVLKRPELPDLPAVRALLGQSRSSEWWICWKHFNPPNWQNTASAWTGIHTGKLADALFAEFDEIHARLAQGNALALLQG